MNNDNLMQTMPPLDDMIKKEVTAKEWLLFYKNVWTRNAMARAIDILTDKEAKAIDPEQPVAHNNEIVAVKVRLEDRKIALQDALDIINAVNKLLEIPDEEFDAKVTSKEALAVDEDMIPKEEPTPEVITEAVPEGVTATAEEVLAVEETPAEVAPEVAPEVAAEEVTPEVAPETPNDTTPTQAE